MQKLALYEWPGNVRQLKHVIEHSVVLSEHTMIEGAEIMLPQSTAATGDDCFQVLKAITMADFEHKYISQLLEANKGNITKAAQAAGIDRRGLRRMIQKHKIPLPARNGGNSPG